MKRLEFLDGLRGVAIILVILFHAYARWPEIVPYGDKFRYFPLFSYGFIGVRLFFLISGFVILMTLNKTHSFSIFLYKRWLRLFPAMLIATVILFVTASFFYERPNGIPLLTSVIPGLIFMEPSWISLLVPVQPIEGAFWSLFVEFKFYFIFGILYFSFGYKKAIVSIVLLYGVYLASFYLKLENLELVSKEFSFDYLGFFASGALAFLYFNSKQKILLYFSFFLILIEAIPFRGDTTHLITYFCIMGLFYLPIIFEKTRTFFQGRILLFVGAISYPLYLIHENTMISLIIKLNKSTSIPDLLLPISPIIILIIVSYIIMKFAEPFVKNKLLQLVDYYVKKKKWTQKK